MAFDVLHHEGALEMSGASSAPAVSILMGVYNADRYLGEVIDSLLGQTWLDFEMIVVDDGSTDRSPEILEEYAKRDSRIRILTQQNQGVGRAVNRALELARGKYIARADADDYSYPQRLEKQVAFMEANPGVVAAGARVMLVDPLGIPIGPHPMASSHEVIEAELLKGNGSAVCQPSVMLRRDALLRVGGYDPKWRVTEDLDLFLRLAEIGKLENMPEILVNWRQHLTSTNHTKQAQQVSEAREVLKLAHMRRGLDFDERLMTERPEVPQAVRLQRWGWNALSKNRRKAALGYALRSIREIPFDLQGYKLLVCVARGH